MNVAMQFNSSKSPIVELAATLPSRPTISDILTAIALKIITHV